MQSWPNERIIYIRRAACKCVHTFSAYVQRILGEAQTISKRIRAQR